MVVKKTAHQDFILFNSGQKTVLAKMENETVQIINDGLRQQLHFNGIRIPSDQRKNYGDKDVVKIEDADFGKAFREILVPKMLRDETYRDEANGIDVHFELVPSTG